MLNSSQFHAAVRTLLLWNEDASKTPEQMRDGRIAANEAVIKVWAVWQELEDIRRLKEEEARPAAKVAARPPRQKRRPKQAKP